MAISCFMAKIVSHHFEKDQELGLISRPSSNEQPGRWYLPRRHWGTVPYCINAFTLLFFVSRKKSLLLHWPNHWRRDQVQVDLSQAIDVQSGPR